MGQTKISAQETWFTITTELIHREKFEQRGLTTQTMCYMFRLLYAPPIPTQAQPPPTLGAAQLPTKSVSSRSSDGIPLSDVSRDSGQVYMVAEIPDIQEVKELSSNEEPKDELKEEPEEDLETGEIDIECGN